MKHFALIIAVFSILSSACSASAAQATHAEMKAMIAELYDMEKMVWPEDKSKELMTSRSEIIERFVESGKPAIPVLLEALDDTSGYGFVRRTAAEAIGKINDSASISPLHSLLKSGNLSQRIGAAESLGNLKSGESAVELMDALNNDSQYQVRVMAAIALGKIGDASATNPLAERVSDRKENASVRAYAVRALESLKATTKILLILTVLEEEHQKSPGNLLAERCDDVLRSLTNAERMPLAYGASHIRKEDQDKIVKAWRHWWESEGKSKYPQS